MPQAAHRTSLTVVLDKKLKARIEKEAKSRDMSMAHLVNVCVVEALDRRDKFEVMMSHPEMRAKLFGWVTGEVHYGQIKEQVKAKTDMLDCEPSIIAEQLTIFSETGEM